jgi:hypothetical protein
MIRPHIFRGLWCQCGDRHYQNAGYYVSVDDDGRKLLALGPFQEHDEALASVDDVRREVNANWSPGGRAAWYGYGTAVVKYGPFKLGKLNDVLNFPKPDASFSAA